MGAWQCVIVRRPKIISGLFIDRVTLKGNNTMQDTITFTHSEKHILNKIKKAHRYGRYDFWFVYSNYIAINYEGGIELPMRSQFRNQYSLENGQITKNW